jgi:hypothetical protein
LVLTSENGVDRVGNINGSICATKYEFSITQRTKTTSTMSNHYGNSLIAVSPPCNSPYLVPKFEKENLRRRRSFASHNTTSSNLNNNAAIPATPRGQRLTKPEAVTPNQRSASYTSPNIVTPQSFDFESLTIEVPNSPHGVRTTRTQSVIGLPSEYPVYQRDESVVSSFASSVASSLLMEELDGFKEFFGGFGDDSVPKVFDSYSCNNCKESPLKSDKSHPLRPPLSISSPPLRGRTLSTDTAMESLASSDSLTIDESKSPHGVRTTRTLSVIGLPSEYPVHQRDGSVVSSFASSIASSLLMEELDGFEEFFGDDSVPKVFDSYSCSCKESPLKSDKSHPPRPPLSISSPTLRAPSLSPETPMFSFPSSPLPQKPITMNTRRVSDSSENSNSNYSLGSQSSRSRRRRNYGMNENDFEKLTDEFSTLTVQ